MNPKFSDTEWKLAYTSIALTTGSKGALHTWPAAIYRPMMECNLLIVYRMHDVQTVNLKNGKNAYRNNVCLCSSFVAFCQHQDFKVKVVASPRQRV